MARICCLAGIDRSAMPMFAGILPAAGFGNPVVVRLDVRELGVLAPGLLVCDVDALDVDPLEFLRRLRFVLPECTIAAYTGNLQRSWGAACHRAGANCLLAKRSDGTSIAAGIAAALATGCYTDPRFSPDFHDTGAPAGAV